MTTPTACRRMVCARRFDVRSRLTRELRRVLAPGARASPSRSARARRFTSAAALPLAIEALGDAADLPIGCAARASFDGRARRGER